MSLKNQKNNKNTQAQPKLSGSYKKVYINIWFSSLNIFEEIKERNI